jgi:hypothetical protein
MPDLAGWVVSPQGQHEEGYRKVTARQSLKGESGQQLRLG